MWREIWMILYTYIYIYIFFFLFNFFFIIYTGVSRQKHVFCRNERRNWRLSLQRHVRRCTFRNAYAEIAEPMDVSKPAECWNYSLRCTLCSGFSVHPFSFLTLCRCRPYALADGFARTLSRSLRLFSSISLDSLNLLYLAYPAATVPHLYALIPVHTDSGYLRESIPRATFTLHNASDLCFFLCAASVTLFRERRKATLFHTRPSSFIKYVKSNVNIFNTHVNIFLQIADEMIICTINCPEI